jgi:4-diphosphocytidyl-2-C-methyl-D-erythritol kinase
MIRFPNCKINLGLSVLEKLPDGYHRIETLYYPVPLKDILEIIPSREEKNRLNVTGIEIEGPVEYNICFRAWELMHERYGIPPVEMHLHKIIPTGAGLGGGSSDAAFALSMMNELFELGIAKEELKVMASQLGMDCPYFFENMPAIGSHKGEILEKAAVSLSGKYIFLVKPDIHVSTAEAYAGVQPAIPEKKVRDIISMPIESWKALLRNDFEDSVFQKHPQLATIKDHLYQSGAVFASMSGSGSALYGIYYEKVDLQSAFPGYFCWEGFL